MGQNIPNLEKETDIYVQEAQKVPNKMNIKISTSIYIYIYITIIIQMTNVKDI